MSFLGRTPSNAPLTTADIPDGIIVAADLAPDSVGASELADDAVDTAAIADSVTLVTPNIGTPSAGVVTNLSGVLPVGVTGGAGLQLAGGFVKLAEVVATGSGTGASFDGFFTSDYDIYKVFIHGYHNDGHDGSVLWGRFRSGGSDVTADNYNYLTYGSYRHSGGTVGVHNRTSWDTAWFALNSNSIDDHEYDSADFELTLMNPLNTTVHKKAHYQGWYTVFDQSWVTETTGIVWYDGDTAALSGMSFHTTNDSGTLTGNIKATIVLYGLRT